MQIASHSPFQELHYNVFKLQIYHERSREKKVEREPLAGCATSKTLLMIYLSIYLFIYLFIYPSIYFIYLFFYSFPCQLPANVTGTVVHVLTYMVNVHPTGNVAYSTTSTAHLQLTTVVAARSSRPILFYSCRFWDQWRGTVIPFYLLSWTSTDCMLFQGFVWLSAVILNITF